MIMTILLTRYASTLTMRYDARDSGSFELEDHFLNQLDELWLEMSEAERRSCDEVARVTKQRHRMQHNFVSTEFHYRHLSRPTLPPVHGFACATTGLDSAARLVMDSPANSASNSSFHFEPQLAYG